MQRFIPLALVSVLVGCAGNLPVPPPMPPIGVKAVIFMKYGAGGQPLSWQLGPGAGTFGGNIVAKFGSGVAIYYYQWTDAVAPAMNAVPAHTQVMAFGDSCGASALPYDAAAVNRIINVLGGFQASPNCPLNHLGSSEPIPSNVLSAVESYNPNCLATFDLGCRVWVPGPGEPGARLLIVQRPDMHPGVGDLDAQQDMLTAISKSFALGSVFKPHAPLGSSPRIIVRYRGQRS